MEVAVVRIEGAVGVAVVKIGVAVRIVGVIVVRIEVVVGVAIVIKGVAVGVAVRVAAAALPYGGGSWQGHWLGAGLFCSFQVKYQGLSFAGQAGFC